MDSTKALTRKAVAAAIFDPGATEGFKGDRTLTEWQTDAVMRALAEQGEAPQPIGSDTCLDGRMDSAGPTGLLVRLDRGAMGSGVGPLDCREAAAALRALPVEADTKRLDWLAAHPAAELVRREQDWPDEVLWEICEIHGGRSDREWHVRGKGETVRAAIDAAVLFASPKAGSDR